MEETIHIFCKSLAISCNHIQGSCEALKQSIDRRPIPLDSASSTFVQCLNRRVSSTSTELNLLESMSLGTVSFEELLGHCYELHKKNDFDILQLAEHLMPFGYIPDVDIDVSDDEEETAFLNSSLPLRRELDFETFDDDPLLHDSLSLKSLGLSEVCLATIASEADKSMEVMDSYQPASHSFDAFEGRLEDDSKPAEDSTNAINVSKNDYDVLPSQLKYLASWESLLAAVEKINTSLKNKETAKRGTIQQAEIESLDLGRNWRSYLLILMRMNRLVIESEDGIISYKLL